tara:strand:+ start:250 stop:489 length:240 start_codon:yes stop_codon:yes gene_type:complete
MKYNDDTLDILQMALGAMKPSPPEPGDLVVHTNDPDVIGIVLNTHAPGDWHKSQVQWEDDEESELLLSTFLRVISRADN